MTWGRDRDEAIARMARALAEFEVGDVPTTIPFHRAVMAHPAFKAGAVSTSFLDDHPEVVPPPAAVSPDSAPEVPSPTELVAEVNGRRFAVRLSGLPAIGAGRPQATKPGPRRASSRGGSANGGSGPEVVSPLQGTVVRVLVEPGQAVRAGEPVCVVEAMKMENELASHRDGTVEAVLVATGQAVAIGDAVARIV